MVRVMMTPMMWRRGLAIAAFGSALALGATACDWRLDSEPPPFRTPSPTTELRDQVSAAEAAVGAAAGSGSGAVASAEAAAVPVRLAALGGVSPTSSPRPAVGLAPAVDAALAAAVTCSQEAGDDSLGGLCASIALSHAVIAAASPLLADVTPPTANIPASGTQVAGDAITKLALEHDKARALFETIAARSAGDEREAALAQSARQRALATALLGFDGVQDLTEPAYAVPAPSVATPEARTATARAALVTLGGAYAALMVQADANDRAWLYDLALEEYSTAAKYGLAATEVPALPGGVEPEPSPSPSR